MLTSKYNKIADRSRQACCNTVVSGKTSLQTAVVTKKTYV